MSYEHRDAMENPPELQAAIDKLAAKMRLVYEARLAGMLTEARLADVTACQQATDARLARLNRL